MQSKGVELSTERRKGRGGASDVSKQKGGQLFVPETAIGKEGAQLFLASGSQAFLFGGTPQVP